MSTYYVDANGGRGFLPSQDGSQSTPFMGTYGLQKAIRTAVAGDSVLFRSSSTILSASLVTFTVSVDKTATWQIGDSLQNYNGMGNHWTGVLCAITATLVTFELITGSASAVVRTEGIYDTTKSDYIASASAVSWPGVQADTNNGTLDALINITGTDASWNESPVLFDCESLANYGLYSNKAFYSIRNILITRAYLSGLRLNTGSGPVILSKIKSYSNTQHGFDISSSGYYTIIDRCISTGNGYTGFNLAAPTKIKASKSISNTREGIITTSGTIQVCGSITAKNGYSNIKINANANNASIEGNVIHESGSGYSGITLTGTMNNVDIMFNRITSNSAYGIEKTTASNQTIREDLNYFQQNTSGNTLNIASGGSSISGTDTNFGYVNYANDNYELTDNATMNDISVNLNWDV